MAFLLRNPHRELEKKLGYSFRRKALLETALMHRSYRFENKGILDDNQRLEFLGDAVLGLVAAEYIFKHFHDQDEGALTCLRSRITSGKALGQLGNRILLGERMQIGKGEEQSGGRKRESNVADALEAIIGAAYLDGGMRAVRKLFVCLFAPEIDAAVPNVWIENPKGRLQHLCQQMWRDAPAYRIIAEEGPSHARQYTVEVRVGDTPMGCGSGPNKRAAETAAALRAIDLILAESTAAKRGGHEGASVHGFPE